MYKRDIYLDIDDNLNNYIKSVELDSNSRVWHFHLTVDYEPLDLTGKSVQFRAEKPDKTNVLNDCKIVDAEKGVVEVKLTRQVNAIPGHVKCLLKIIGDEGFVLKTKTFVIDVSKTLTDEPIVSSDEFGALEVALGKVQDIDNRFAQTNAQLSQKASQKELAVERARIDSFTKLNEGSTTGDAELIDARVGADGIVYQNLGEAIRKQISNNITSYISLPFELISDYYINYKSGNEIAYSEPGVYFASDFIKLISSNESVNIKNLNYPGNDSAGLAFYSDNKTFISGYQYNNETDLTVDVPDGAVYMKFTLGNHDYLNSVVVYQNQYNTITAVAQDIKVLSDKLSDKLNVLMNETDVTENVSGVYISSHGYVVENGGASYHISNPISVKKYSILIVKAEGYKSNVAILSKCLGDGDRYECLVRSEENVYEYIYFVPEDMEVALCSSISTQWQLHIMDFLDEPLKDLNEGMSNIDDKVTQANDKISNIFVPYNVANTNAYIHHSMGTEVLGQTPHLASTDYVNVANMKSFTVNNLKYGSNDLAGLSFYDKDKVFIKGHQYNNDVDLTVDVPEKAVYVRLTLVVKYLDITCITSNVVDMVNSLENTIQRLNTEYSTTYLTGHYINYKNGELATFQSESLSATEFIKLDEMFTLLSVKNLNYRSNDLAGLCFYDKSQKFISGYQYNNDLDVSLVVPNGATYVRFTVPTSSIDGLVISGESDIKPSMYKTEQRLKNVESVVDSIVEDNYEYCQIFHKIAGIGDSLMSGELAFWSEEEQKNKFVDCYNYSWLSNLCKNIGAEAVHYSRGGQTTKTWLEQQLPKMKEETILPSAYYIALGTNDSDESKLPQGLGTFDDCGTDKETFYALYSKIIREVQAFNPHAKIFCCSLYYGNNDTITKFCNAIKEMSEKYGCYYVDFINTYGQFYKNSSPFISVGHFTSTGYVRVAREMQILTNEIISKNQSDFRFVGLEHKEI